jgi:hypothetical protein
MGTHRQREAGNQADIEGRLKQNLKQTAVFQNGLKMGVCFKQKMQSAQMVNMGLKQKSVPKKRIMFQTRLGSLKLLPAGHLGRVETIRFARRPKLRTP